MRKLLGLLVLASIGLLPWAPALAAPRGTVTIAINGEPETMDPHTYSSFIGAMVWPWVSDLLVIQDRSGQVIPWLAEKYERLDSKRIKFTLRNATFSDGTPVTSEAVAYSMGRIVDPENKSYQRSYWKDFDKVEVLDDRTFIFHMKVPDNGLIRRLSNWVEIISLKNKGRSSSDISLQPIAGGPYILKSWTRGQKMVLEANPTWWGNDKYPNRPQTVVIRPITEGTTRVKALQAGEIDIAHKVFPHFIPQIKADANLDAVGVSSVRIVYIGMFTTHGGPLADVRVRQAVNYAIDAPAIYKTFLAGYADPAGQMFHPWTQFGYNPEKQWYGFDPAKAKQLLKEAGYEKGFKADFISPEGNSPFDRQACEAATGMLQKVGIDARCLPQPFSMFRKSFNTYAEGKNKTPAVYFQSFGNSAGDSSFLLRGTSTCQGAWSGVCYKEFDEAVDKAAAMEDPKEQQVAFEKVSDMMKDLALFKVLYRLHDIFGINKRIEFKPRHDEQLHPWEIVVKQ